MRHDELSPLVSLLAPYDPIDLLSAVAGLQLMPENADRTIRLEVLAHVVASLSTRRDKPAISVGRLRTVCNSVPLESLASLEDPFDNPFTEAFTFHGGSFIVFPGIVENPTFVLRQLAKALFLYKEQFPSPGFLGQARMLISAVLALSDEVAKRAGLGRGVEPTPAPGGEVIVPDGPRLARLKQAVRFTELELIQILDRHHVDLNVLEPLTVPLGVVSISDYEPDRGELLIRPLVKAGNEMVVAIPGALLLATRNALIRLALEHGIAEEVARRYSTAVWHDACRALGYLGNTRIAVTPPAAPDVPCLHEGFFILDRDKVLYAMLLVDPLDSYNPSEPLSEWEAGNLRDIAEDRLRAIEKFMLGWKPPPNEILFLVLLQTSGRVAALVLNPNVLTKGLLLGMSAADLETIALLEGGDPLALWKYAKAAWRVRQHASLIAFGELDEFYLYRKFRYSYYVSDEAPPTVIGISAGGAGELRREVARKLDPHGALWYDRNLVVEVASLYGTRDIPIYAPLATPGKQVALLVEGLPLPVWIVGARENEAEKRLYQLSAQFADAIAYWLWQFTPSLAPALEPLADLFRRLLIRLHLPASEAWFRIEARDKAPEEPPIQVAVDPANGLLDLTLRPSLSRLLEGADNRGERELVRHILRGLRGLLPEANHERLSDERIAVVVDRHAPLGQKKKILFTESRVIPELDPRGLPSLRKIHAADENEWLDELGKYFKDGGLPFGNIPDDRRNRVLHEAVIYFYHELQKLVSSLHPDGLLEWLVAQHEAIMRAMAYHSLTIPTRLACFGSEGTLVEELTKEIPDYARLSLASRFLIEYAAAQPPSGLRPLSLSVYDRLLALAGLIIDFGYLSDLVYYEIADLKLSFLPSGRLGVSLGDWQKARQVHLSAFAAGEIHRACVGFEQRLKAPEDVPEIPDLMRQIDLASQAEFGHTLTDIITLAARAMDVGEEISPAVAVLPLEELVDRLAQKLGWNREKVRQIVNLLTLAPRPCFLEPGPPFRREDVYPWRLNRSLSYLRRPFLLRERRGSKEIVWGHRHLHASQTYLVDLCCSGRLKARTSEMRKVMGKINNLRGEAFADKVAGLLEQQTKLIVRRRVKKIGQPGKALRVPGDIDVLVVDPQRRRVMVVECKDLALGRTPQEMHSELVELFIGSDGSKPAVQCHQERAEWVSQNLDIVLDWLRIKTVKKGRWAVGPLVVVDQELLTPYLRESPVPIVAFAELEKAILEKGARGLHELLSRV